ncbi:hypothetical protein, partial [Thiolapillus sp.]|uniref:hypothetical protein n=1 Tax=Thiolapillus sp. TaxID=2017437 RepID=UPI003AF84D2C
TTQQLRKLVAAPYLAPNDWTPRSEAYFVFPLAQGTPGKQCCLAATGVYQPSLRSPWLAANAAYSCFHQRPLLSCSALQVARPCPGTIDILSRRFQCGFAEALRHDRFNEFFRGFSLDRSPYRQIQDKRSRCTKNGIPCVTRQQSQLGASCLIPFPEITQYAKKYQGLV